VPLILSVAAPAFALIPDEEDEELLSKAKANRKAKLSAQKETTRSFLKAEGLTDKALELELISVQKAIYNLAKAGSQLEAGDMRAAVGTLTDTWATPFTVSVAKIGGAGAEQISAKFGVLKAAAIKSDATASKRAYVDLVGALQSWSAAESLSSKLKGLN